MNNSSPPAASNRDWERGRAALLRSARLLAYGLERLIGRRNMVRVSRFMLNHARRDMPNRMDVNGEWLIQDAVMRHPSDPSVVFDVGANVGRWSERLLRTYPHVAPQLTLHAFEPAGATFSALEDRLSPLSCGRLKLVRSAVSDRVGEATLFKAHELAGSNSLYAIEQGLAPQSCEQVHVTTVDGHSKECGIQHIPLLKIDAEGNDSLVIDGAVELLRRRSIELVQFEYNAKWILARRYLRDVFERVGPLGYVIGKVTSQGVEWYDAWSSELETYREGNYLAALPIWRDRIPSVRWWGDAR